MNEPTGKALRIGICRSPQRATIDELRSIWQLADEAGFDSCWTSDHFATGDGLGPQGDVLECWTLLGAMAEGTRRVRVGCMVTGNTYRHPGVVAKMAVTVDHLSGGRLDVGLGAGAAAAEHTMLGMEFGAASDRISRLEEACQILTSLWSGPTTTFAGQYYRLTDAVAEPKPVQHPHVPLWIGGAGRKGTLRITAKYANAWNMPRSTIREFTELNEVLDRYCTAIGRNPATLHRSVVVRLAEDPQELLPTVESYARAGAGEVIVMLPNPAVGEKVASLLPGLRSIG